MLNTEFVMLSAQSKTFAEFFAGIGLVREGLRPGGWSCIYANDIDSKKEEIYRSHFGDSTHFHLGDVWDTKVAHEHLRPAPFLATASFPCTDLSLAGHWKGIHGEKSSAFFGFARTLLELNSQRPPLVLLENVPGLLTSRNGADFGVVANTLADLGYWVDAFEIDARWFVPQSRMRVFVLGVHESIMDALQMRSRSPLLFESFQNVVQPTQTRSRRLAALINDIDLATGWLSWSVPKPSQRNSHLRTVVDLDDEQEWWGQAAVTKHHDMMSDRHRAQVDQIIASGESCVGTIYRRKRHGKTRAEVRLDGVAGCLRTPRGGSARQILIAIDNGRLRMRWMSPREYARLQGAGNYPILGNVNQMLFGFGDAVCVPVIEWIDTHVLSPVFEAACDMKRREAVVA